MPDQFGNPTPLEVLAKIGTEQQDLAQPTGPGAGAERNAALRALGKGVSTLYDPRLERANAIQTALSKSLDLTRGADESDLDFEIRRRRQMFEDVKHVDPTTAATVSSSLVKLEEERQNRERLKATEARAESAETRAQAAETRQVRADRQRQIHEDIFYEVDPNTLQSVGKVISSDDPTYLDDAKAATQGRGNILLNADEIRALRINTQAQDYKLLGSDLAATKNRITGQIETVGVAKRLGEVFSNALKSGSNTQTYLDTVARGIEPIIETVKESMKAAGKAMPPEAGSSEFAEDVANAQQWLQKRGIASAVPASMMARLAYTWAKSFDNRVTDKDFDAAYRMLSGNTGNPAAIMASIREETFGAQQDMMNTAGLVIKDLLDQNETRKDSSLGYKQGVALQHLLDEYNSVVGEFRSTSDEVMKLSNASDRHSADKAEATGATKITTKNGRTFSVRPGAQ